MDKYLVSLAILLLSLEVGWLLQDMDLVHFPGFSRSSNHSGASLGKITLSRKQVRKKSSSSIVWEETRNDRDVFAYDSVLTLDQSAAEITLNSGSQITLHENTLVSIEPPGDGDSRGPVRLKFKKGTLKTAAREPQSVTAGEWIVEVNAGSHVTVRSTGDDHFEVETNQGAARVIDSATGKVKSTLVPGRSIAMDAEGLTEKQNTTEVQWELPKDGARVYSHDTEAPVNFKWTGTCDFILIHNAAELTGSSRALGDSQIPCAQNDQTVSMALGNYLVRLQKQNSQTFGRNLSIWPSPKIYLLSPLPRQRWRVMRPIPLIWNPAVGVKTYRWQISRDADFQNITQQGQTEFNSAEVPGLPLGQYYWRVTGQDELGYEIPAFYISPFTVVENPLAAPKLKTPSIQLEEDDTGASRVVPQNKEHSFFRKIWNEFLPRAEASSPEQMPPLPRRYFAEFQWEKVDGAAGYVIEISERPDFVKTVTVTSTTQPSFKWKNFKLGRYYWRVAAKAPDGEQGFFSEVASADLTTIPNHPIRAGMAAEVHTKTKILSEAQVPIPEPTPAVAQAEEPVIPPDPLNTYGRKFSYGLDLGAKYFYEQFIGSDFKARESGFIPGELRLRVNSLSENIPQWRLEIEVAKTVAKINNSTQYPFQDQFSNLNYRLALMRLSPYEDHYDWGIVATDQYSLFNRTGDESVQRKAPVLIGPMLMSRAEHPSTEDEYRLGIFTGQGTVVELSGLHVWFKKFEGSSIQGTASLELKVFGGLSSQGTWYGGTPSVFLGVRW